MGLIFCIGCEKAAQYGFWKNYGVYVLNALDGLWKIIIGVVLAILVYWIKDYFDKRKEGVKEKEKRKNQLVFLLYNILETWDTVVTVKKKIKIPLEKKSPLFLKDLLISHKFDVKIIDFNFLLGRNETVNLYRDINSSINSFDSFCDIFYRYMDERSKLNKELNIPIDPESGIGESGSVDIQMKYQSRLTEVYFYLKGVDESCDYLIEKLCSSHKELSEYLKFNYDFEYFHGVIAEGCKEFDIYNSIAAQDCS